MNLTLLILCSPYNLRSKLFRLSDLKYANLDLSLDYKQCVLKTFIWWKILITMKFSINGSSGWQLGTTYVCYIAPQTSVIAMSGTKSEEVTASLKTYNQLMQTPRAPLNTHWLNIIKWAINLYPFLVFLWLLNILHVFLGLKPNREWTFSIWCLIELTSQECIQWINCRCDNSGGFRISRRGAWTS